MNFEATFISRLPEKPYCTNSFKHGLLIRDKHKAIGFEHIQVNAPYRISCLIFDLDFPGAANKWEDANLPPPTWISINPETKHAHLVYMLKTPVLRGPNCSMKALSYMTKISLAYSNALNSDINYKGVTTKNPLNKKWDNIIHGNAYELSDLAEYVNLDSNIRMPTKKTLVSGRNCELFEILRIYAYSIRRKNPEEFTKELLTKQAIAINNSFPIPLEFTEIKSTVKSIHNWTLKKINPEKFSQKQKDIRLFVGERTKKEILESSGSPKEIAEQLAISERTVYRHIKRTTKLKPWEEQNISRATWYRRNKYSKMENHNAPL